MEQGKACPDPHNTNQLMYKGCSSAPDINGADTTGLQLSNMQQISLPVPVHTSAYGNHVLPVLSTLPTNSAVEN
jgi:hypothetical protein